MKVLSKHISSRAILKILLFFAVVGIVAILFAVNRMNGLLNKDLGFDKDSTYVLVTSGSSSVLSNNYIFSSAIPGFKSEKNIMLEAENNEIRVFHQFVSQDYFDFFNYQISTKLPEGREQNISENLVYINESVLDLIGASAESIIGTKIYDSQNNSYLVCGVVRDFSDLDFSCTNQAKIFQLSTDHLKYAFTSNLDQFKDDEIVSGFSSFQQILNQKYTLVEDILYSAFLFSNIFILLLCLGNIGLKYMLKKDTDFIKTMSVGIHVVTLVISKTYRQLIAITLLVVVPLSLIMQKFWLGVYVYRIKFGWLDLFIVLAMILLTVYLICCPKKEINKELKLTSLR
jgi:hypothetical protein